MNSLRIVLGLLVMNWLPIAGARGSDHEADIRVMSFNIRYGTAADGDNHWNRRKEFLVETIKAFDPDLLGTQETLGFQRDFLAEKLEQYESVGVGREDGRENGEMMALYYRKSRFKKLAGGHFWLSETPEIAGSKSWGSSLPRMVTWVKLQDSKSAGAKPVAFFNTHFDHLGVNARFESARLLRRQLLTLGKDCSIVVTGDFNTGEGGRPYQNLFDRIDDQDSPVIDTYRRVHPRREAIEGTFSGFVPTANSGARIDWIAVSREWQVVQAEIIRTGRDGRTPSDHFPVVATLRR